MLLGALFFPLSVLLRKKRSVEEIGDGPQLTINNKGSPETTCKQEHPNYVRNGGLDDPLLARTKAARRLQREVEAPDPVLRQPQLQPAVGSHQGVLLVHRLLVSPHGEQVGKLS